MLLLLRATDPQAIMDLANEVMHQFQELGIPGRKPGAALLDSLAKQARCRAKLVPWRPYHLRPDA